MELYKIDRELGETTMSRSREAIDTITGYFYQFDYYIMQLLELSDDADTACIEGIEDVDINHLNETTAIQCKYYSKTEYNHSVIAKPIRLMLNHYKETLSSATSLKYRIYGNYSSGHSKLPNTIDLEFVKEKFLTYTHDGVKHEHHIELGLTDTDLSDFLTRLIININAISYEEQQKRVISKFKDIFTCCDFEGEYYYYNNALRIVKEIATKQQITDRTISKREFLTQINNKERLFDSWYLQFKGLKEYCKSVKMQYFSQVNISSYERFFLIDCDSVVSEVEIKSLLLKIAKNWSKLSRRDVKPFCPYIYLHNISAQTLINIKQALQNDDFYFIDGYDFLGASFSSKSISRKANADNGIKLKIITEKNQINQILQTVSSTKEIYQFFIQLPFYENSDNRHLCIKINETKNINSII